MRATIKDVATLAGVSQATVSYVLNNETTAKISGTTRKRVSAAASKLNYRPSVFARSLKNKSTQAIALVIPDVINPFFPEVVRGAEDVASKFGYSLILCNTDDDLGKESHYFEMLKDRWIDGIIFSGVAENRGEEEVIKKILESDIPLVLVDREIENLEINSAIIDNVKAGYIATKHLVELGHENIGIISGPLSLKIHRDRIKGYQKALAESGVPFNELLIKGTTYREERGYRTMKEFLLLKRVPTAIFAFGDFLAIGVIRAIRDKGLKIPEDLAVVGFDDILISRFIDPPLTTVAQPKYQMGAIAIQMLIKMIKKEPLENSKVVLEPELIVRKSSMSRKEESKRKSYLA